MTAGKATRKIIKIDEKKCNGCGLCVPSCVEGALQIIEGKAKLVSDTYCDGLGACLGECPQGAISIEEREADAFDEAAAEAHIAGKQPPGCPSAAVTGFERSEAKDIPVRPSRLGHWPVQLTLVPPTAAFLQDADLVFGADCVPFAYADFHRDFLSGRSLIIACPKLDDFPAHLKKLTEIFRLSSVKSVTVVRMEVPCCAGLIHMVQQALQLSGKDIPVNEVVISIKGEIKS